MSKLDVAILMGSQSDAEVMSEALNILKEFGVSAEMKVLSAHRTPKECSEFAENFRKNGGKVFICGAGVGRACRGRFGAHNASGHRSPD